jgi:peroxiredoxin
LAIFDFRLPVKSPGRHVSTGNWQSKIGNWIQSGGMMAALSTGKKAPEFTLQATDGSSFSLKDALAKGPVVAAFFKISCPTCQYAFPFLERIYKAYGGKNVTIVGISQNTKKDTVSFLREFGIRFPVLLDDAGNYPVSNAYGLTNVPTIFWIAQDGEIEVSSVGWARREIAEINAKAAEAVASGVKPVFHAGEQVAEFRAG